jgi:PAS domain S-box-containing protein
MARGLIKKVSGFDIRISNFPEGVVGIYRSAPDGKVIAANLTLARMLGLGSVEELLRASAIEFFVDPEDRRRWQEAVEREGVSHSQGPLRRRDGGIIWVRDMARVVRDSAAGVLYYEGMIIDITEQKRAEEALRESEERYRLVAETATDAILTIDEESRILYANRAAERIFGYSLAELLGQSLIRLMPAHLRQSFHASLGRYLDTGEKHLTWDAVELTGLHKSGKEIPVEVSFGEFTKDGNRLFTGIIRDISERKRAELERQVIFEITQGLNATANLDELLWLIHHSLKKVLYAENCFVALCDRSTGMFHFPYFVDQFDPVPSPQAVGKSGTAHVFRTGRPMLVTEEVFHQLEEQGEVELVGTPSPSWLGVPLKTPSETIGVLVVQHYQDEHAYTERDLEFLASVGSQIALAIERKRTEEALGRRNRHLRVLNSIASAVSTSLDVKTIMEILAEQLVEQLDFKTVVVMEYRETERQAELLAIYPRHPLLFSTIAAWGLDADHLVVPFQADENKVYAALLEGRDWIGHDFAEITTPFIPAELARTAQTLYAVQSIHNVPIMSKGKLVGTIVVGSERETISDDERSIVLSAATEVAAAIENARLYEEAKRKALHSLSLVEVTKAINSTMKVDELLDLIVEKVLELTDSKHGSLFLLDEADETLTVRASRGFSAGVIEVARFKKGEGIAGWVADTGQGILIQNVETHPQFKVLPQMERYSGMIEVPLVVNGKVVGVLSVDRLKGERPLTEAEFRIAQDFAEQAALALANARLLEETQQKNQAVRESEERYRRLVELTPDAIAVHSEGQLVFVNTAGATLLGAATPDELVGRSIFDFVHPDYRETVRERLRVLTQERSAVPMIEEKFVRLDGTTIIAEVAAMPSTYKDKPAVQVVVRDITERKRAESGLRRSQQQYQTLVESVSDIVLSCDTNGRVTYINPAVRQVIGYAPEEMIGRLFRDFIHPDDIEVVRQLFLRRLQGDTRPGEFRIVAKNGAARFLQGSGQPVTDEGKVVGITSILRDVTEQRRAEERLARIYDVATRYQGQELFDRAAAALAELVGMQYTHIAELEEDGRHMRALSFYRRGATERGSRYALESTPCERVITERQVRVYSEGVQELFPHDAELSNWNIESYIGAPILGSDGEAIGIVNALDERPREFTETEARILQIVGQRVGAEILRQRQEDAQRKLQEQLLQAQKMEAIGLLAGGVAHDFNNILGGVLGYASFIKQLIKETDEIHPYINTIEMSARRAAELTQQLLGFARGGKYQTKPVSANRVIEQTVSLLEGGIDKSIQIQQHLQPDLWLVDADAGQIQQALLNICINACDAMPGGGRLTIESENIRGDGRVLHPAAKPGHYITISISDTGIGMDHETQQKIFEPFFTTKEKSRGTGLGLAMVYGIVKNHGGYINVYSEVGQGSTFRIYLPALPGAAAKEEFSEVPEMAKGDELVLVVDDEDIIRNLCRDILSMLGYRVLLAENGRVATDLYRQRADEIALVIIDMIMPKMGGLETFLKLKEINPKVKAILSTGYSQTGRAQEILSQGVHGFVQKPYAIDELAKAIRKALDSGA